MEVPIAGNKVINIQMKPSSNSVLDEVTITGTGVQKKATITGAITTVDINTLKSSGSASTSITNALAGNVAGIIGMQSPVNQARFLNSGYVVFLPSVPMRKL